MAYWYDWHVPFLAGWVIAYAVSLGVGWVVVDRFHRWGTKKLPSLVELPEEGETQDFKFAFPPWATGVVERTGITTVSLVAPEWALPAIAAWLGLKMAANWNKQIEGTRREQIVRARHAFLGLISGAVSCGIAWESGLLGNLIIGRWYLFF